MRQKISLSSLLFITRSIVQISSLGPYTDKLLFAFVEETTGIYYFQQEQPSRFGFLVWPQRWSVKSISTLLGRLAFFDNHFVLRCFLLIQLTSLTRSFQQLVWWMAVRDTVIIHYICFWVQWNIPLRRKSFSLSVKCAVVIVWNEMRSDDLLLYGIHNTIKYIYD